MLLKKMFVRFSQCNNTETTTDALLSIKSLFEICMCMSGHQIASVISLKCLL